MEKKKSRKFLIWFKNQTLGKKILYAFIIAAIIPLIVIQLFMIFIISDNLKGKMDELMVSQLLQVSERVELNLNIYTNIMYQIYTDDQIITSLNDVLDKEETEREVEYRAIYNRLQQHGTTADGIRAITLICADGSRISYDFKWASSVDSIWDEYDRLEEIEPYRKAQQSSNMVITETMRFDHDGQDSRLFHISKNMYDFEELGKGELATVIMSVDERVLNHVCNPGNDRSAEEYSLNFITDKEGNVLTYPNSFYAGIPMNPDFTIEQFVEVTGYLGGKEIAVNVYEDENLNWNFYNVYDKNYMLQDVTNTQRISLITGLLIMGFSIVLIIYIVKLIEQSVSKIIAGIQEVQKGNLEVIIPVESSDEIGQIADDFNTMTGKVKGLIAEVTDVTRKQKEAEIRALEAQINPHFLYNTLDSINWMAIDREEYEISKMLRNLGVILRYSINKSNQLVTIQELADWLEKYVSLQQMRFNQAFSFQLYVAESTTKVRIYKLLLQPFVENAIVHGFKGVLSGGILRIDITLSEDEEYLNIIIEDNGKGLSAERVEKYNDRERAVSEAGNSIGIQNAFSRMQMYYGDEASWNITSIPEIGTVITLKIPVTNEAGE